uniref:UDP-glycosyltransferase n=1 Tax=Polyphagotarsonemus latus TaxID=1204166 RepID=A0AAN0LJ20_9ACAR
MSDKKKIAFYGFLTSGHMNLCSSVASVLLNNYPDELEIYFFTDSLWAKKLSKVDSRFKFEIYDYKSKDQENYVSEMVKGMEPYLYLSNIDKIKGLCSSFYKTEDLIYVDLEVSKLIKKLKPDYILCDMVAHMPSLVESKIPYSFIVSCNPLVIDEESLPICGLDAGVNEKEKIKSARLELKEVIDELRTDIKLFYKKCNVEYNKEFALNVPLSEYLSIYCFPKELDYFDDTFREKNKLLQVDSPVVPYRIPPPYKLPDEFANLPGKIIYVSLGSLFSYFETQIQKLIDALSELPYKFIVSKGSNGDKIKFPNNRFIGENYINQLAVLQVVDLMIAHGGNNTFTECFYFGVPSIIFPFIGDQINNAKRIEETGFGFQMDLMNYTKEELKEKIIRILSEKNISKKMKQASERIKNENNLEKAVKKFYESLDFVIN